MSKKNDVMFYYLRGEVPQNDKSAKKGVPIGCVAIRLNEDGTVNRGVAVCSPRDRYNKDAGRGIALSRLLNAENQQNSGENFGEYSLTGKRRAFNKEWFNDLVAKYRFKSGWHMNILPNEHRMFFKPEDR